ncbi:MAG TPA: glycine oxidase ThiO [Candidatus Dormibacteraeota bacterium]|nr:glycine oxidase ThiO [Candidatus Dormibacteraeota bacterium]
MEGDVVIIGAGLIGLALARELAQRGAEVRILDTGEPGRQASWAAAGMLAPSSEGLDGSFFDLCAASLERFPAFAESLRAETGLDVHLRREGFVAPAYDDAGVATLEARVAAARARGYGASMLSPAEAVRLEPALAPVRGAGRFEHEASVDNRRLGRALRAAVERLGVRVEEGVPWVRLAATNRRVNGVETAQGFVPAPVVVNAAGAWAGSLEGVPEQARVPVVPVKGQMLALGMPANLIGHTIYAERVAYLVPRDDGHLIVGATVEHVGFDTRVTAAGIQRLLEGALRVAPALRELSIVETWAGLRPGTPDGLPYLGAGGLEGYFLATGHLRNGVLLTPITAEVVADAIEGRAPSVSIAALSPERAQLASNLAP